MTFVREIDNSREREGCGSCNRVRIAKLFPRVLIFLFSHPWRVHFIIVSFFERSRILANLISITNIIHCLLTMSAACMHSSKLSSGSPIPKVCFRMGGEGVSYGVRNLRLCMKLGGITFSSSLIVFTTKSRPKLLPVLNCQSRWQIDFSEKYVFGTFSTHKCLENAKTPPMHAIQNVE